MASESSWGPCIGKKPPEEWTDLGPIHDPWMISDDFETFIDDNFWR